MEVQIGTLSSEQITKFGVFVFLAPSMQGCHGPCPPPYKLLSSTYSWHGHTQAQDWHSILLLEDPAIAPCLDNATKADCIFVNCPIKSKNKWKEIQIIPDYSISMCYQLSVKTLTIVCASVIPVLYFYIYMHSKEKSKAYDLCTITYLDRWDSSRYSVLQHTDSYIL